jgi:NTE family protein
MPIALALSGGGIRAMAFHLGVLRWLAENKALEQVSHISTVSGGSLILGLILQETSLQWPTSQVFQELVMPTLRQKLCSRSLMNDAISQLRHPSNWRFLLSRANLVAMALRESWQVSGTLADLPVTPEWSINGTTAETGKRFRFKQKDLGDYVLGYASSSHFPLANALAVSAAFPGGIGPLVIDASSYEWHKRPWNEPPEQAKPVTPLYPKLHLYDGGVYDNLGLEPFFDAGKGQVKGNLPSEVALVVSDAGAPLAQGFSLGALNPWRMKRVNDIMSDQARALRVRTFVAYLLKGVNRGAYLYIGEPISEMRPCPSALFSANFPTTLKRLSESEFDRLVEHGYQVTSKYQREFGIILN